MFLRSSIFNCCPLSLLGPNLALASVDGFLAFIAFYQVTSSILYLPSLLLVKAGFAGLMHVALSSWGNDEEENSTQQALLDNLKSKSGTSNTDGRRKCCPFQGIHVGSRQKFVIVVVLLVFILMMSFAIIIWSGAGKNPVDSSIVARVYVDFSAAGILLLGGALGCYGLLLFLKFRKVWSERASLEMWKVAGLAAVSVISFSSSAMVASLTDIPLSYNWNLKEMRGLKALILLILYYFIGSTVPSAFLLWVMRELPAPVVFNRQEQSRVISFIHSESAGMHHSQRWATATSLKNQVSRASPI